LDPNDAKFAVALLASGTSLTVALIQVLIQRKNARSLEKLKATLDREKTLQAEYLKAYMTIIVDGQEQRIQAFKAVLQRVQLLRDKVRGVLSEPESYSVDLLKGEIRTLTEGVVQAYAEHQVQLPEPARQLAHVLKNTAIRIQEESSQMAGTTNRHRSERHTKLKSLEQELAQHQSDLRAEALRSNAEIVARLAQHVNGA
jgi:hypothetical protein